MTHRELYLHAMAAQVGLGFTEDDVVLHVVPLFHVNGWGTPHFLTMIGGQHVMLRRFDPTALMAHGRAPPGHPAPRRARRSSTRVLHSRERSRFDLSSLRQLIIGGVAGLARARPRARVGDRDAGDGRLRPDRDVADHHPRPAAAGPDRQRAAGAPAGAAVDDRLGDPRRPDPGRRGRRRRRPARRRADRRDRGPRQHRDGRLLPRPRGDRGDDPRRLAAHRRHGHDRRGRLRDDQGPLEGHHHQRRREHLVGRDRGRPRRPPGRPRDAPSSPPRTTSAARSRSASSSSSRTPRSPPRSCGPGAASAWPPTRSRARSTSATRCPRAAPARSSRPSCASRSGPAWSRASTDASRATLSPAGRSSARPRRRHRTGRAPA